ncbi:hypothetical protein D0962_21095 [Leptolyngbyaceae cyanobacterium CCMR0082]|uniref:HNH/Endo VII superfamily nuclease toxins domain-containing protein n=1 Tax=Adonisia turfae CCMR0082 TaxID=2304604 RepID=A0A6M0SB80_9CYAN|nr:hypothetical protein [Adonisia turfae CCMR0082]
MSQLLDDVARGAGSIGDDIGRALAGSGNELVPALPRGGRLPTGAVDDLNPATPLRSQGNPGPNRAVDADSIVGSSRKGQQSISEGRKISANSNNTSDALNRKFRIAENAQERSVRTRQLPDGRVRCYEAEVPASKPGPSRGRSHVTEYNPRTGRVREWEEVYDHAGNMNRVHPKTENGLPLNSPHFPPTGNELGL